MSPREEVKAIIDHLTNEQVDELLGYIEDKFLPEPPNAVHSIADIERLLEEADDDIRNGRVISLEEAKSNMMKMFEKL